MRSLRRGLMAAAAAGLLVPALALAQSKTVADEAETRLDETKRAAVEAPIDRAVKNIFTGSRPASVAHTNPTVKPGLVKWHESFDAALAAAKNSNKPILVFQLLGRLDQEFC